jgi:hypothetical protein
MRRKVIITTPYPTVEEVAAELGVSKKRVRELEAMYEEIVGRRKKARSPRSRSTAAREKKASRP